MFKKVIFIAAFAAGSLVFVSCSDKREELVKNFHTSKQSISSVKINLPQEIVINTENTPITVGDSINLITADFKKFWSKNKETSPEKAITELEEAIKTAEEVRDDARNIMLKGIRTANWGAEFDGKRLMNESSAFIEKYIGYLETVKEYKSKLDMYSTMDLNRILVYTFDASTVTSIPLNDTSIEVTNTYVLDANQEVIIDAFSKDINLASILN